MTSYTLTLSARESILRAYYNPPIDLHDGDYEMGLVNFETYNAIPNVDRNNNALKIDGQLIEIPVGSYELVDINAVINSQLKAKKKKSDIKFSIRANNNTLKCIVDCDRNVDWNVNNSIGPLLGFGKIKVLKALDSPHESAHVVDILRINTIKIECNIIHGAYMNDHSAHTIHEFFPSVPPGYKIIETPQNVIYMPLNTKKIDSIVLKIVDQDDNLINFREEVVTIRLHLREQPRSDGS